MEWFAPKDHPQDCFFCQTEVPIGSNKNKDDLIRYAFDLPSVKRAILSSESAASDDSGATADEETERADNDDDFGLMSGYDDDIVEASNLADQPVSSVTEDEPMNVDTENDDEDLNFGASTSSGEFKAPPKVRPSRWSHAPTTSNVSSGSEFQAPRHFSTLQPPKPIKENIELTQERMNDLVRDMNLTKENAELLASRLKDFGIGDGK